MFEWNNKLQRRGDHGSNIRALQQALTALGFDPGIDGDFGPKTENAVKAFQKESSLSADGIVGKDTVAAINNKLEKIDKDASAKADLAAKLKANIAANKS